MPIYEFVCQSCGHEFEKIVAFSDTSLPACTACAATEVVRRLGKPAIHFKGSGWYITDSKKANDGKKASKSGDSTETNGAGADSGESKPETKVEGKGEPKSEPKPESKTESNKTEPAKPVAAPAE